MNVKTPFDSKFSESSRYPLGQQVLYAELVSRHDSLLGALMVRKKILQSLQKNKSITKNEIENRLSNARILEATLWFLTIEFYSRFLSDPGTRNGSKRCIMSLINKLEVEHHEDALLEYCNFKDKESEVIRFIKIQRDNYFAHADEVSWNDFPKVFDDEYERLLIGVGDLLDRIGHLMGMKRVTSRSFY